MGVYVAATELERVGWLPHQVLYAVARVKQKCSDGLSTLSENCLPTRSYHIHLAHNGSAHTFRLVHAMRVMVQLELIDSHKRTQIRTDFMFLRPCPDESLAVNDCCTFLSS